MTRVAVGPATLSLEDGTSTVIRECPSHRGGKKCAHYGARSVVMGAPYLPPDCPVAIEKDDGWRHLIRIESWDNEDRLYLSMQVAWLQLPLAHWESVAESRKR